MLVAALFLRLTLNGAHPQHTRHLLKRWLAWSLTIGIFTLVWAGLRYEAIDYLSVHAILALIAVWALVWLILIF